MYFTRILFISLGVVSLINSSRTESKVNKTDKEKCATDKKVCGSDGKTYANSCALEEAGTKLAHEGECVKQGATKTAYRPDLILKSKTVNNSDEGIQKKLVKHFNPTTGKWEYTVEILPTIVITPTFHQLKEKVHADNLKAKYDLNKIFGAAGTVKNAQASHSEFRYPLKVGGMKNINLTVSKMNIEVSEKTPLKDDDHQKTNLSTSTVELKGDDDYSKSDLKAPNLPTHFPKNTLFLKSNLPPPKLHVTKKPLKPDFTVKSNLTAPKEPHKTPEKTMKGAVHPESHLNASKEQLHVPEEPKKGVVHRKSNLNPPKEELNVHKQPLKGDVLPKSHLNASKEQLHVPEEPLKDHVLPKSHLNASKMELNISVEPLKGNALPKIYLNASKEQLHVPEEPKKGVVHRKSNLNPPKEN
uniref:Putative kazal type serine protease inhibitor n=1 Tax=Rhodnius prolixus TaxID=13249 RepID=R4G5N1_RHOPR